jgi:hypothetical protein
MRTPFRFLSATLALSLAVVLGACGGDEKPTAGLALEVHPAAWDSGEFDPLNTAGPDDIMEIIAARPGQPDAPVFTQVFRLADRRGTLDALPIDDGYRLVVRGFRGPSREFLFYGGTPLFDIVEGKSTRVAIQVGRPDCTMLNHNSSRPSFFVLNGKEDTYFKRWGSASAVLPDGRVLITGGGNVNAEGHLTELRSDIEIYDPRYGQFFFGDESPPTPSTVGAPQRHACSPDGRVVIFGGLTTENACSRSTHATSRSSTSNDPVQKVRTANVAVLPRASSATCTLRRGCERDGSVLFTGGIGADGQADGRPWLRYFPDRGRSRSAGRCRAEGHLQDARVNHAMTPLLREGTLALVAGGQGADGEPLKSLEVMVVGANMTECVAGTTPMTRARLLGAQPVRARHVRARFGHRGPAGRHRARTSVRRRLYQPRSHDHGPEPGTAEHEVSQRAERGLRVRRRRHRGRRDPRRAAGHGARRLRRHGTLRWPGPAHGWPPGQAAGDDDVDSQSVSSGKWRDVRAGVRRGRTRQRVRAQPAAVRSRGAAAAERHGSLRRRRHAPRP